MPCPNEGTTRRRQWRSRAGSSPSAAPSAARGRRELSRRCLSPPGRVSTRPAGRGGARAPARAGAGAGRFIHLLCRHKKYGRSPGRDPANRRRTEGKPRTKNSKDQLPDPVGAGATNSCPNAAPQNEGRPQPAGNGEAEPAAASAAQRSGQLSVDVWMRELDATRRAGGARVNVPLRQGVFIHLSVAMKKGSLFAGRDPDQQAPTEGNPENQTARAGSAALTPACAGRRIVTGRHAHEGSTHAAGNGEGAGSNLPSAAPEQPAAGGKLSRRCRMFARAKPDATRREWSEESAVAGAAAGGRFLSIFLCRHKKDVVTAGARPANHRQHESTQKPKRQESRA